MLKLIIKAKNNAFKLINSILYRCTEVIIDRQEKYPLAEVYMYPPVKMSKIEVFHCGPCVLITTVFIESP